MPLMINSREENLDIRSMKILPCCLTMVFLHC